MVGQDLFVGFGSEACWWAGSAEDGGKGRRKGLVWGEQEIGPKEGTGKTK